MVPNPQDRSERSNPEGNQTPTHNGQGGIQREGGGCDLGESGTREDPTRPKGTRPPPQRTERGSERGEGDLWIQMELERGTGGQG